MDDKTLLQLADESGIDIRVLEDREYRRKYWKNARQQSQTGSHLPATAREQSPSDKDDEKAGNA